MPRVPDIKEKLLDQQGRNVSPRWYDFFRRLSPISQKGDLLLYGSDNSRLPVGTDGYVLTARSTATNGLGVDWELGQGGSAIPSCAFTVNALTSTHATNLTTEGSLDWMCPGGAQKATGWLIQSWGGARGAPLSGTFYSAGNNWTNSCSAGDASTSTGALSNIVGQFSSSPANAGQRFTVPADTHSKFLRIYSSSATPYQVQCYMSDGNSYASSNITSINSQIVVQYNASRDGCQMTVMIINVSGTTQNIGTMGFTLGTA